MKRFAKFKEEIVETTLTAYDLIESDHTTEYSFQVDHSHSGKKRWGYSQDTDKHEFDHAKNQGDISSCTNCEDWFAGKSDQKHCFKCLGHKKS